MVSLYFYSGLTNSNYKELNVLYDKYRTKGMFTELRSCADSFNMR